MKIAIVTGASSGLGTEFVRQIEDLYVGLNEIWVIARREQRMEALERELKTPLRIFALDLLKEDSFSIISDVLEAEKPDIRMLVNAAGFGKMGKTETISVKSQTDMIDINCKALTHLTCLCLPYLSLGSRIVNVASSASFCPQPDFVVYAATKSYVLSFSRGLGSELQDKGIIVTAVCPGPVDTEFFDIAGSKEDINILKKLVIARPEQVVRLALLDSVNKKSVSVYGASMKVVNIALKLIPHSVVLKLIKKL